MELFSLNGLNCGDFFELSRNTKTRSNHPYKIQTKLAKLNCYKYPFFVRIIKSWNDLPSNVINCPNFNKFKIKTEELHEYLLNFILILMIFICYLSDFYIFLFF